jgi:phage-related protein
MPVSKSQRALVLVNSLSQYSTGIWKTVYQVGEWSGKTITLTALGDDYAYIYTRTGGNATKQEFLSKLKTAATKSGIRAVDVFFHLHGGNNTFIFHNDEEVSASTLRDEILALNLPNRLRLCYNLACYGDSQNYSEMLDAGFVTTIGSKKIACTAAAEFPIFCSLWQFDNKISDIMPLADNPLTRAAIDTAVSATSPQLANANSTKVIRGNRNLRISSSV